MGGSICFIGKNQLISKNSKNRAAKKLPVLRILIVK